MKIWYPISFEDSGEDQLYLYIAKCSLSTVLLKSILRSNINSPRWGMLTDKLKKSSIINVQNKDRFNAVQIPNQYISYLTCSYDYTECKCYYAVADNVRCTFTTTPLNDVVKLVEFGNDSIPPMNWIRHSYAKFADMISAEREEK